MPAPPADDQTLNQAPSAAPRDGPSLKPTPADGLAQARVDQMFAWRSGRRDLVETLIERHPGLAGNADAVVELAYNEFRLRLELGESPSSDEYLRRFPTHSSRLRHQFALHSALQTKPSDDQTAAVHPETGATLSHYPQESPSQTAFTPADGDAASPTMTHVPDRPVSSPTITRPPTVTPDSPTLTRPTLDDPNVTADRATTREFVPGGDNGADTAGQTIMQAESLPSAGPAIPSKTVPGYELLGELGRGGMGVVYKARHVKLNRMIALKMILSGEFASSTDLHRFNEEAKQLARLQHPNIVQVYEVGEHDGRPFFAMEFMDGGSLAKQFAHEPQQPPVAARTIETLARAAHHAHVRHVVHRDLKPANILLSADGTPKITDFGLAKGLDAADSRTVSGAILGTPSYMAPEQASGHTKQVGPAADTYALGAILYEALTGRPPFRAATAMDTVRMVVSVEPVPPSYLIAHLPRDLETICLKCLEKDAKKRYASSLELAEDLQRYLENRPILARPVPLWEKAWKWVRRRPAVAALIGLSTFVVLGGAIGGVVFAHHEYQQAELERGLRKEADTQRALAEHRFQQNLQAVDRYFTDVSESTLLDGPGLEDFRVALLRQARHYYEGFVSESGNDPKVRAEYARGIFRLGRLRADLDEPAKAIELFQQALATFQELAEQQPENETLRADIASTWYYLGRYYRRINQTVPAEQACVTAVGLWERLANDRPDDLHVQAELARSLLALGNLHLKLHRFDPAYDAYTRSLTIRQRLVETRPKDETFRRDYALTCDNLATLYGERLDWPQAEAFHRQAHEHLKFLVAGNENRTLYRDDLARNQLNLGMVLLKSKQPQPAVDALRNAVKAWDRLHELHPRLRDIRIRLSDAYFTLSQAHYLLGQFSAADDALNHSRSIRADLVRDDPGVPDYQVVLARCDEEEGDRLRKRREPVAAVEAFRKAQVVYDELANKYPTIPLHRADQARCRKKLGQALVKAGQTDVARDELRQSLELWESLRPFWPDPTDAGANVASVLRSLCELERSGGNPAAALEWFQGRIAKAEALRQNGPSPTASLMLRNAYWGMAEMQTQLGRYPEALTAWEQAIVLDDGGQRGWLRLFQITTQARTPDYAKAVEEGEKMEASARPHGTALYQLARAFALAAQTAGADQQVPPDERQRRSERYATRAVEVLHLAQGKDYFQDPDVWDDLTTAKAFDVLRQRPEFQKLLADVKAPAPAAEPPAR